MCVYVRSGCFINSMSLDTPLNRPSASFTLPSPHQPSLQFIAELTYNMLSPGPSCQSLKRRRRRRHTRHSRHQGKNGASVQAGGDATMVASSITESNGGARNRRRRQDRVLVYPAGIYDGITNACHLVSEVELQYYCY